MNHGYGQTSPPRHAQSTHRPVTRFLVLIEAGEVPVARLFLGNHEPVAEFDGSTEEVATMIRGLAAALGAVGPEWDRALAGHSAAERAAALVYCLPA